MVGQVIFLVILWLQAREEYSINTHECDTHAYRMEQIQAMLHETQVAAPKREKDLTRTFIHQVLYIHRCYFPLNF